MNRSYAMLSDGAIIIQDFLHQVAHLITMRQARRRAHVTRGEDSPVEDHNTGTSTPIACGTLADLICQVRKVLIPIRSHRMLLGRAPPDGHVSIDRKSTRLN